MVTVVSNVESCMLPHWILVDLMYNANSIIHMNVIV